MARDQLETCGDLGVKPVMAEGKESQQKPGGPCSGGMPLSQRRDNEPVAGELKNRSQRSFQKPGSLGALF